MPRSWYAYNGTGDPSLPASYSITFSNPPPCINGCKLCAINATGTGLNPTSLSNNIRGYIMDAMVSQIAQPTSNVIKYVLNKPC